jgi:hypothetical protein
MLRTLLPACSLDSKYRVLNVAGFPVTPKAQNGAPAPEQVGRIRDLHSDRVPNGIFQLFIDLEQSGGTADRSRTRRISRVPSEFIGFCANFQLVVDLSGRIQP